MSHPITTFFWFNGQAEAAGRAYAEIFDDCQLGEVQHLGPNMDMAVVSFTIRGSKFVAMDCGPDFMPTPGVSFTIECDTQEEIDHYWTKLGEGGQTMACGWLTDRFGLTWQIVPAILMPLLKDPIKGPKVQEAFMKMEKFILADILAAAG